MKIDENGITDISDEDKQLLYDAMVHYTFSESAMGRSTHFAADIHMHIAEEAGLVTVRMRENWKRLKH